MNAHVETLVQLFVKKEKRERMLALASKAQRRSDFRHDLLHDTRSLDPKALTQLPASGASVDTIMKALRAAGAGDRAYCISEVIDIDDHEMRIVDALRAVVGKSEDSIVFAIGSRAAYYENHEGEQYILQQNAIRPTERSP
jgi:hypothetical protein